MELGWDIAIEGIICLTVQIPSFFLYLFPTVLWPKLLNGDEHGVETRIVLPVIVSATRAKRFANIAHDVGRLEFCTRFETV